MKKELKEIGKDIAESYFYWIVCFTVYFILIQFHVHPYYPQKEFNFWTIAIVWAIVYFGGDFLSKKTDRFFLKRKAIKAIKSLGHKKSDIDKIEIIREGNEDVVEITLKDDKGEKE